MTHHAPVLAHTGPGGAEVELLMLGAVALAGALALKTSPQIKSWVAAVVALVGVGLIGASFVTPRIGGATATSAGIDIVSPASGASVPADEPVIVETNVTGVDLGSEAHLHVLVDDELQTMIETDSAEIELEAGSHTITVQLSDAQHRSFDPPVEDSVEVVAE